MATTARLTRSNIPTNGNIASETRREIQGNRYTERSFGERDPLTVECGLVTAARLRDGDEKFQHGTEQRKSTKFETSTAAWSASGGIADGSS